MDADKVLRVLSVFTNKEELFAALRDENELAPYVHMTMMLGITLAVALVLGFLLPHLG